MPGRPRTRCADLWARIGQSAHDCAEPGLLFVDRINANNSLGYNEHLSATNPCGEVALPPYGACKLSSLNLTAFVHDAFTHVPDAQGSGALVAAVTSAPEMAVTVMMSGVAVMRLFLRARARPFLTVGWTNLALFALYLINSYVLILHAE